LSAENRGIALERDAHKLRCDGLLKGHEQFLVEAERRFQLQQNEIAALNSKILADTVSGNNDSIGGQSSADLSRTRLAAESVSGKDDSKAGQSSVDLSRTRLAAEHDKEISELKDELCATRLELEGQTASLQTELE
jgi:hypothetical protein